MVCNGGPWLNGSSFFLFAGMACGHLQRETRIRKQERELYVSSDLATLEDQREYELVFVLVGNLDDEAVRNVNERLNQVITSQSGTVNATEIWGRRTLAYPIGKNFDGIYILERFQMPPSGVEEVERHLRFNENVIRHLLIRTDE
jgi:small subunit ribosomal protein S6